MPRRRRKRRLWDLYAFPGFRPSHVVTGIFGDPRGSSCSRHRPHPAPKRTRCGTCGLWHHTWYDRKTRRVRDLSCGDRAIYLDIEIRRVACRRCGTVKQERLDFLADSPFYTKRFAFFVGRRCRASTIRDVARDTRLNWKTVKALEMQYMREQLRRAGRPGPRAIGIDEISIRKGHTDRIVVSDPCGGARSGLAARIARRRAWMRSSRGSGPGSRRASGWR